MGDFTKNGRGKKNTPLVFGICWELPIFRFFIIPWIFQNLRDVCGKAHISPKSLANEGLTFLRNGALRAIWGPKYDNFAINRW